jgi:GH15 family glucan-1,4-alpha-glucosidase
MMRRQSRSARRWSGIFTVPSTEDFFARCKLSTAASCPDATVDASLFAVFALGCLPPDDKMVLATISAIETHLAAGGGIARFEHDGYMREGHDLPGNPWFICTLWLADHYIAIAKKPDDLARSVKFLTGSPNGPSRQECSPNRSIP